MYFELLVLLKPVVSDISLQDLPDSRRSFTLALLSNTLADRHGIEAGLLQMYRGIQKGAQNMRQKVYEIAYLSKLVIFENSEGKNER